VLVKGFIINLVRLYPARPSQKSHSYRWIDVQDCLNSKLQCRMGGGFFKEGFLFARDEEQCCWTPTHRWTPGQPRRQCSPVYWTVPQRLHSTREQVQIFLAVRSSFWHLPVLLFTFWPTYSGAIRWGDSCSLDAKDKTQSAKTKCWWGARRLSLPTGSQPSQCRSVLVLRLERAVDLESRAVTDELLQEEGLYAQACINYRYTEYFKLVNRQWLLSYSVPNSCNN